MTRPMRTMLRVGLVAAWFGVIALAQGPPSLEILSPRDGDFLTGPVTLQAVVRPLSARVASVTFFADGQVVCQMESPPWRCSWNAGPGVHEHGIRVVAQLADGGRLVESVRTRGVTHTEAVDVASVQVSVLVTDRRGRFVTGLTRRDFRVREGGEPQTLTFFGSENYPLDVVAALDISGSMKDAIGKVKEAVKRFLATLREKDTVTVLAFNNSVFSVSRSGAGPASRLRALDRLTPWGGTALHDAIVESLDLIGKKVGRKAIVVFTDGDDQDSRFDEAILEARLKTSDAVVYMVGEGRGVKVPEFKKRLETMAEASGGRALLVDDPEDLDEAFQNIVLELSHQYVLGYTPSNAARDGSWRRIEVEVANARHRLRYREGYQAPSGGGS